MAGLDSALRGAVAFIEKNLLIDTVRVSLRGDGEPVLNTTSGQLEYPEGDVLYEGPGGVVPGSATMERSAVPDAVQPWAQQTRSTYVLLTPLAAPIPPENAVVSVVSVHDPSRTSLLGRTWICADQGQAGTVEVVRRTALDQNRPADGAP
ncbi:DUF6093 family protein [Streptomyces rubiginosohelvolus]|uniref:Uncharacterized protein n=1 Tax=Streptomyces rubiginosohelvolus TaxID=67362 RepID=A0ABQ3CC57_9ACTN|nr:DUF6093 family protein [Streptomyces pluricolorescens]GGZ82275.1 hypothetical protein GCM10010328_66000 [Streptomyces pluricolorescens]